MREHTINKIKSVKAHKRVLITLLVIGALSCCAKKAESFTAQDQQTPAQEQQYPVLSIPFVDVLDNYFLNGDTSGFAECIGMVVTWEEMRRVNENYGTRGFFYDILPILTRGY